MQNNNLSNFHKTLINEQFLLWRRIALIFMFFVIAIPMYSQKFDGGLLAGFNGSQVRGDISNGFHKLGFVGGAWIKADINEKIYWSGELKFNQKGSRINPNKKNDYVLYIYRLNYVDLPVLIGYRMMDYFSLFGGVSMGYLINSKLIDNYGVNPSYTKSQLHSYEIGMLVGVKVDFNQLVDRDWASKFILDFRFQFSAMSIYSDSKMFFYYSPYGQYNSLISTSLYYTIGR
jgi:hypothetical protein